MPGLLAAAKAKGIPLPPEVEDPDFHLTTHTQVLTGAHFWPKMGPQGADLITRMEKFREDLNVADQPE